MKNFRRENLPFLLFTVLFIVSMFVPRAMDFGQFIDGLIYSTLAHNLAIGRGSFWEPEFINAHFFPYGSGKIFYAHPPLMYYLLSLFYKVFGSSFYVDKIYAACVVLAHIFLFVKIFSFNRGEANQMKGFLWLPILLWYLFPQIIQRAPDNMLDNTLSVFCMASIYALLKGMSRAKVLYLFISSCFLVLAFLTKGPVALFPLVTPILYYFVYGGRRYRMRHASKDFFFLLVFFLLFFLLLMWFGPARHFMDQYFHHQVFPSMTGQREKINSFYNHVSILIDLIKELIPLLVVSGICFSTLFYFQKKLFIGKKYKKQASFFVLIGLSASLPIMISSKSHPFYLIPSFPYFALALAYLIYPGLKNFFTKKPLPKTLRRKMIQVCILGILATFLYSYSIRNRIGRHNEIITDLQKYALDLPESSLTGLSPATVNNWAISTYLERHYQVYTTDDSLNVDWMIVSEKDDPGFLNCLSERCFTRLSENTETYHLYKRNSQ